MSKQSTTSSSSSVSDTNKNKNTSDSSNTLITVSIASPPEKESKTPSKSSSILPSTTSITFATTANNNINENISPATPNLKGASPLKTPPNAVSRTSIDRSSDIRTSIDRGNVQGGSVRKNLFNFGFGHSTKIMWNREITKHILLFLIPIISDRVDVAESKGMVNNIFQSAMNLLSVNTTSHSSSRRARRPSKIYGKGMIGLIDCVTVMRDVIHSLELVNKDFFFVVRRHFSPIFYADVLHLKFLWMTSEDTNRLILRDIRNYVTELKHISEQMPDKKPDKAISLTALKNTDYFHRQSISDNISQSNPTDYKGLFSKINHAWYLYRNTEIEKGKRKHPSRVRHGRSQSFNVTNSFDYPSSANFGSLASPRTPSRNGSFVNNNTNTLTNLTSTDCNSNEELTEYSGRVSLDQLSDTTRDRGLSNSSSNSNLLLLPHDSFNFPPTPSHNTSMGSIPTTPQRGGAGGLTATPSRVSHRRTYSSNNTLDYETMYKTFRKSEEQIEEEEYLENDKFSTESQSRIIRVAIMGDKTTGKSMLSMKFAHRNYDEFFEHNPEDDLITIDNETYSIDIFDTPGQDVSDILLDYNISHFDLFILLFDLTNSEQTLPYTQKIIDQILNRKHFLELSQIPIIICGNKLDIMDDVAEHIYIKEQVEDIIKNKFIYSSVPPIYVEVSSETGENITNNKALEQAIVQQYHKCNKFGKVARTIDWNSFVKYVFNFGDTLHVATGPNNKDKCLVM
ncbi:predicted protein [Naegleria gruberi]|uniref:Predicted protein n=1 Tax=Naegleria gruberi TaxID=5762 RepID=D2V8W3_NAEGR|nr:uncharacterized protein NAEGRDRAFT_65304 [Naegleria gruberi]EFC46872.1 predicted protein [Naegleria gruberi]|eukprot:XP_002679616.1 predicted protein [Naegleria gruberi strain NEG-M]